jgi:enolase
MKIAKIEASEILDSRGWPTVEVTLTLSDGRSVTAATPSGASVGKYEALELRDGEERYMGKGVTKAISHIEHFIAPSLLGKEPDTVEVDSMMIQMDDTENKSHLGANAILPVSIAVCKAQALVEELEPYELIGYLCGHETVALPCPMFNVINGGAHANNNLSVQEFMIMPVGMPSIRSAIELGVTVFQTLKEILRKRGDSVAVGDEGGFAPNFESEKEALDTLMEAIKRVQDRYDGTVMIALDVAASQLYTPDKKLYMLQGKRYDSSELIDWYEKLISEYPIYSIEDGLGEDDWAGWQEMTKRLGGKTQLVGDDIFVTNPVRIWEGLRQEVANAVLIKPNQIGTVTETLQAVKLCQEQNRAVVVSHRSGETNDFFIADLATGVSAPQIKAGGCSRGERMAKYNRLLQIEDQLLMNVEF